MFGDSFGFHKDSFFDIPSNMDGSFNNLESLMKPPRLSLDNGNANSNNRSVARRSNRSSSMFDDMLGDMDMQFNSMQNMFQRAMNSFGNDSFSLNDHNGSFYSSSSVYTYQNDGSGEPSVYQAHKSVKQGPGGIREEQRAERDSRKQEEKMAIGRYIGDRGKQTERRRNIKTGQQEENNDLFGLDESEVEEFGHEWEKRARQVFRKSGNEGNMLHSGSHNRRQSPNKRGNCKKVSGKDRKNLAITDGRYKDRQ